MCVLFFVIWMRSYETGVVMSAVISRAVQNMKAGSCTMPHHVAPKERSLMFIFFVIYTFLQCF